MRFSILVRFRRWLFKFNPFVFNYDYLEFEFELEFLFIIRYYVSVHVSHI